MVTQTQGTDRGRPWFEVIDERMKDVVAPILEEVGVQLELVLLIEDGKCRHTRGRKLCSMTVFKAAAPIADASSSSKDNSEREGRA